MSSVNEFKSKKEYELSYDYTNKICEVLEVSNEIKQFFKDNIKDECNNDIGFVEEFNDKLFHAKIDGQMLRFEKELSLPDGTTKYYFVRGKYIASIDTFFGILIDDTATNDLKEKLIHDKKLKSLCSLAGGIAHDFNNQLMVILGSCELINKTNEDETLKKFVNNIVTSAKQSSDLINKLLIFGNIDQIPKLEFNLVDCLDDTMDILKTSCYDKVKIIYDVFVPNINITGNFGLLQNAFLNLCKNSIDAFDSNGVLMIKSDVVFLNELPKYCINNPKFKKGVYALVQITDNACGMEKELIEKVFDPFFTTKGFNQGPGLGLSTVLGTIDMHDGIINVKSVLNKGSVFSIYLKINDEVEYMSLDFNFKKEIIVIDDEYLVRMVLRDILLDLNYEVICFDNGADAIKYYKKNQKKISLVISDMMMPEMTGREVFHKLKKINNDIKFIVLSGFSNEIEDEEFTEGIIDYLRKPIMFDVVKDVVSKSLK